MTSLWCLSSSCDYIVNFEIVISGWVSDFHITWNRIIQNDVAYFVTELDYI